MILPDWPAFSAYLYGERGLKKNTSHRSRYARIYSYFSSHEITRESISGFILYLENNEHLSNGSINNHLKMLKHLLFDLGEPFDSLIKYFHRRQEIPPAIETLCKDELKRLVERAYTHSFRNGLIVETLAKTAMRISELCNLKDSDFYNNDRLILRETKNGTSHQVPILGDLKDKFIYYMKHKETKSEWLFGSHYNIIPAQQSINTMLKTVAKEVGITKKVSAHKIRHTFATLAIEDDINPMWLKEVMNHKSLNSTMRYVHLSMKPQLEVIRRHPMCRQELTFQDACEDSQKLVDKYRESSIKIGFTVVNQKITLVLDKNIQ